MRQCVMRGSRVATKEASQQGEWTSAKEKLPQDELSTLEQALVASPPLLSEQIGVRAVAPFGP